MTFKNAPFNFPQLQIHSNGVQVVVKDDLAAVSSVPDVYQSKVYSTDLVVRTQIKANRLSGSFKVRVVSNSKAKRACIAYMESTVVDISIPPPSFKPVSLLSPQSLLSKTSKQVFFLTL